MKLKYWQKHQVKTQQVESKIREQAEIKRLTKNNQRKQCRLKTKKNLAKKDQAEIKRRPKNDQGNDNRLKAKD